MMTNDDNFFSVLKVPNHTSDDHEWFKKSVRREAGFEDYYVWHNGIANSEGKRPLPPNNWVSFITRAEILN
jgi:alpha-glucosidase